MSNKRMSVKGSTASGWKGNEVPEGTEFLGMSVIGGCGNTGQWSDIIQKGTDTDTGS